MGHGFRPDLVASSIVDRGTTRDGYPQLRRRWPVADAAASVLIVHGLNEHSGRYEHVGRQLADNGLFTVAFDHRGFGASGGSRSYIDRFSQYLDDVEDHLAEMRQLGVPTVLLGMSMGGLVATTYVLRDRPRPDLLVLSAPLLGDKAPAWMHLGAAPLAAVAPRLRLASPYDSSVLSRNAAVCDAYDADPLVERKTSSRLGAELFDAMEWARRHVDRLDVETLVLHGGDDELVPTESSEILGGLPGVDRRVFPGLRHEVLNEPEGPDILGDMVEWVRNRI